MITDKVLTQNGADFTFVCGKVPFAVSCSSDLPHKNFNAIDLDLINKMKVPLKKIRVTRMLIQGHDLRCVGVVSQTIQCVVDGKVSGTIHLYAKVVRDLFNSISVDCLASSRTYSRLMGHDPEEEPPDCPSLEVLGGEEDDHVDVPEGADDREDVAIAPDDHEDVASAPDDHEDVASALDDHKDVASATNDHEDVACAAVDDHEESGSDNDVREDDEGWQDYYDSDGNFDPVLTDYVNNADRYPDDVYYQGGKLHKIKKKVTLSVRPREKHCQFCFLSGQPVKVTVSHNDMDIQCPSMSDVDRRRIHGDAETDKWLARIQ